MPEKQTLPGCPLYKMRGCQLQNLPYPDQLR